MDYIVWQFVKHRLLQHCGHLRPHIRGALGSPRCAGAGWVPPPRLGRGEHALRDFTAAHKYTFTNKNLLSCTVITVHVLESTAYYSRSSTIRAVLVKLYIRTYGIHDPYLLVK